MLNSYELEKCRAEEIFSCDANMLTDLKKVCIDRAKPKNERMESFIEQVRNPYLFRVGNTVVKVAYGGDRDISDVIADIG